MIPFFAQDAWTLVTIFKEISKRVVAVSSSDVYRSYDIFCSKDPVPGSPFPIREDAPLRRKLFPYRGEKIVSPRLQEDFLENYDKILVEKIIMSDPGLPGTVVRLPVVYGPGDRQHRIFPYLKRMDDDRPVIILGEEQATWRWTRGYVENVALAISLAVKEDRARGCIYNVGESSPFPEREDCKNWEYCRLEWRSSSFS